MDLCETIGVKVGVSGWLSSLLLRHKRMNQDAIRFLQTLFTILWSIWNHRNVVVPDNIQPNPRDVVLMALNLSCRY